MTLSVDFSDMTITRETILQLDDPHFISDNVCVVTGAGSGIGRAVAIAASLNGLVSIGVDINNDALKETAQVARDLGGEINCIQADLTNDDDIESVVAQAAKKGHIRYLANIAGIQNVCPIEDFPMEKYDQMQSLMLRAPFYLSRLMIPHMKKSNDGGGVIGNMASIHAHIAPPNKSVYCMAKFGLRGLTQAISAEGQGKIRSFSISTGHVKTPLVLNQIPDQARTRNVTPQQVVDDIMLGKSRIKEMMTTAEAANLFMFAFSSHARFMIGSDLLVDGGTVLTYT
jgi:3-hydroxybutyrate dehydrogenase